MQVQLSARCGNFFTPFRMIALFITIFCILALVRWQIWSYGADTGIFSQAIAAFRQGFLDGPEAGTHFRFHWSPIIALLSPLLMLFRSPLIVQWVQVGLIAATALPLYALVKRYADEMWARKAIGITLLYAPLFSIAFEEFHELAFYPVLAIGLIEAADRGAWRRYAIIALASLFIREDVLLLLITTGLLFIGIGFGYLKPTLGANLAKVEVAYAGLTLVFTALATMLGYFLLLIPHIGHWSPSHFYTYAFADGPLALILALVQHPLLITNFLTLGRGTYLLEAFLPLLFLPLRSLWLLPGLPGLALILLASSGFVWRMGDHYTALWIPWALLATFDTLLRLHRQGLNARVQTYFQGIFAALVVVAIAFNPTHLLHYMKTAPERAHALQALAIVPHNAHVLMHDEWFSHVALDYPNATVYPYTYYDWVVIDQTYDNNEFRTVWLPQISKEVQTGRLKPVTRYGNVLVYRRYAPRRL